MDPVRDKLKEIRERGIDLPPMNLKEHHHQVPQWFLDEVAAQITFNL